MDACNCKRAFARKADKEVISSLKRALQYIVAEDKKGNLENARTLSLSDDAQPDTLVRVSEELQFGHQFDAVTLRESRVATTMHHLMISIGLSSPIMRKAREFQNQLSPNLILKAEQINGVPTPSGENFYRLFVLDTSHPNWKSKQEGAKETHSQTQTSATSSESRQEDQLQTFPLPSYILDTQEVFVRLQLEKAKPSLDLGQTTQEDRRRKPTTTLSEQFAASDLELVVRALNQHGYKERLSPTPTSRAFHDRHDLIEIILEKSDTDEAKYTVTLKHFERSEEKDLETLSKMVIEFLALHLPHGTSLSQFLDLYMGSNLQVERIMNTKGDVLRVRRTLAGRIASPLNQVIVPDNDEILNELEKSKYFALPAAAEYYLRDIVRRRLLNLQ